jgi:phosphoglycolate phosphatase
MTPTLLICDFDGTLVDSERGIVRCIEQCVAALGLPPSTVAAWRDLIGVPLSVQLEQLLPPDRRGEVAAGVELYRSFWFRLPEADLGTPFPGVEELLRGAAPRVKLAIATSKGRRGVLAQVAALGWDGRFEPIVTPDDVTAPKPHPESLLRVCAHHGLEPAAAVYLGDSRFDMEMAVRAGVAGWGATWGLHGREALLAAGAARCFDSPAEVAAALATTGASGEPVL